MRRLLFLAGEGRRAWGTTDENTVLYPPVLLCPVRSSLYLYLQPTTSDLGQPTYLPIQPSSSPLRPKLLQSPPCETHPARRDWVPNRHVDLSTSRQSCCLLLYTQDVRDLGRLDAVCTSRANRPPADGVGADARPKTSITSLPSPQASASIASW